MNLHGLRFLCVYVCVCILLHVNDSTNFVCISSIFSYFFLMPACTLQWFLRKVCIWVMLKYMSPYKCNLQRVCVCVCVFPRVHAFPPPQIDFNYCWLLSLSLHCSCCLDIIIDRSAQLTLRQSGKASASPQLIATSAKKKRKKRKDFQDIMVLLSQRFQPKVKVMMAL